MLKPFRYLGRTSHADICDDCHQKMILRAYETTSGYLYLCPTCGRKMEQEYAQEQYQTQKENGELK